MAAIDIAPLVPGSYAKYRPVVADALAFFLQRLAPARLEAIQAEQCRLAAGASLAERFVALIRSCPTLHKLGQVLARDRRLNPELRLWLQTLESLPPRRLPEGVRRRLETELKGFDTAGLHLSEEALAEASVALVVPFSWAGGGASEESDGVFKVLKPGVEALLEEEIAIWRDLGALIDGRCADYGLPEIRYADTFDSVRQLLASEIRLDREQAHLAEAGAIYRGSGVLVPRLLPFCTPRVTAMECVYGVKVTQVQGLPVSARRRIAGQIVAALIAQPLWSPDDPSLFHADPHAGNLFHTRDGGLAILDWSLVGRLGKRERERVVQIVLGALRLDPGSVARALDALLLPGSREAGLRQVADTAVERLLRGGLPGFRWLLDLLDDAVLSAGARFGHSLILFRKSILTLDGVLADVATGEDDLERGLMRSFWGRLVQEWPLRGLAAPGARSFGSHLSNLDLLALYWAIPEASLRCWGRWFGA